MTTAAKQVEAIIDYVTMRDDGGADIFLMTENQNGTFAGGDRLHLDLAPLGFTAIEGTRVTITGQYLYVRGRLWARRIGYGRIKLANKPEAS